MNKLLKMVTIVASFGAMLNFAGCGESKTTEQETKGQVKGTQKAECGSVENKPEEVVLEVLKALQKGNSDPSFLKTLNEHCTEQTAQLLFMFGKIMTERLETSKFSVISVSYDDDVAVVKIKEEDVKAMDSGELVTEETPYSLKKIGGQWKFEIDKENDCGDLCISQKSVTGCVEAFKAAVLKNDDGKCKEMFTDECWEELQGKIAKASAEELAALQGAVREIKTKYHKKSKSHDEAVEVGCEMPGNPDGSLILKMVDGKWKIAKID